MPRVSSFDSCKTLLHLAPSLIYPDSIALRYPISQFLTLAKRVVDSSTSSFRIPTHHPQETLRVNGHAQAVTL